MDKENGERSASCDRSEKSAPPTADTPNLLDAASLFGDSVTWSCAHRKLHSCKGSLRTSLHPYENPMLGEEHSHLPETTEEEVAKMKLGIRKQCLNTEKKPIDVLASTLVDVSDSAKPIVAKVEPIRRDVRPQKRKLTPPVLSHITMDWDVPEEWKTVAGAYWPRTDATGSAGANAAGHTLFGGMPGGYGHPLSGAYSAMLGSTRAGSAGGFPSHGPPTTSSYGSLGTLSVAASQAASLGINPASAAWWTMASQLAAQDYLARLQASAAATGMPGFATIPTPEGLLPGYPMLPHAQTHVSASGKQSSSSSTSSSSSHTKASSLSAYPPQSPVPSSNTGSTTAPSSSSHHHSSSVHRGSPVTTPASQPVAPPTLLSDSASILGGVRLPPDTEIIKYTSSIIGPKVPGTTNRGRKKTISLDPPSVSVMPTHSSTGLLIERTRKSRHAHQPQPPADYRESADRVEVIKLPASVPSAVSNGRATPQTPLLNTGYVSSDAPLNLSLKPSSSASPTNNALQSLSSLSQSLGSQPDRTSRRKPGPKPRRVTPSPLPPPGPSPSPSLAQLFAAADSPRPSSGSEENESGTHHKDGRPRNLGRGVSKPKKNTVASLLAQSRALGLKPGLDLNSPLNHQVSLLKANILQQQMQVEQAEREKEIQERIQDRLQASSPAGITTTTTTVTTTVSPTTTTTVTTTISATMEDMDRNRKTNVTNLQQANYRSLEELKALIGENLSDQSSLPDVSTDSNSESDFDSDGDIPGDRKREGDHSTEDSSGKRRKIARDIEDLRITLELGWRRETLIRGLTHTGNIQGDVTYITPCGRRLKQYPDVLRHLEKNGITGLTRDNFSFSSRVIVGDFLQPGLGTEEPTRLSEQEINRRMDELKSLNSHRHDVSQYLTQKVDREKFMIASKEAKRAAREEALRQREQARLQKEHEKTERQEALRKEKEQRSVQMMEGRKRLAFTSEQKWQIIREIEAGKSKSDVSRALGLATSTVATIWKNRSCVTPSPGANNAARRKYREVLEKQRQIEIQRRQQERELKRQQAALLKEQLYMQELNKQRELLYTVELERERRRQHMTLVKALEARKKIEERERKRQEARAEKLASRERRLEQRRIEVELLQEIRKPVEDMELTDLKPLPTLNRIHGLKLSGQAFSDTLMVFEFLHNFGETLGFDMESLPTLNSLQNALLGDEEAEEELLSVMTHLIICAIEDPGIPNPARHTTLLGQSLKQADITHANLSEILRIYLYANATGEVKALTGVHFERDREKRISDHHNNMSDSASEEIWEGGKNAAFFVALRENQTWKMSEWLRKKPFLALNATHKAAILAFLCHELLQNKAVIRQIDGAIETVAQLRRDRWMTDTKIRKLKHLHNRKVRQLAIGGKPLDGIEEEVVPKEADEEEDAEVESGNESEGTQPEEEEDKKLSVEELGRKLEKLNRQAEQNLTALTESNGQLRATCYGQDRFWRRYWCLPTAGGVYVEAMESAEPDLFRQLSEEEDAERPYLKEDEDAAEDDARSLDTDVEMPHLIPEVGPESLLLHDEVKKELDALELDEKEEKSGRGENGRFDETECDDRQIKAELSGAEDDYDDKNVFEDKLQSFQPLQFERLVENAVKATAESGSLSGGQGNGNISDSISGGGNAGESEPSWFNILPREACDTTSVTQTASTFRCGTENSELRIPVFPPPPPASPSLSQCDSPSPAPLALTPEESAQLEYCKVHGLPRSTTPKPVPQEMRYGWWRITEAEQLQGIVNSLHPRGARERELKRTITRPCLEQSWDSTLKMCVRPGSTIATEFILKEADNRIAALPLGVPQPDSPDDWNHDVALRVDMAVLEQVEAMEDKVANASMQVKGWKVPGRVSTEEGARFRPACSHPDEAHNPVALAKNRLIALEAAIERRYLKPPLGMSTGDVNLSGTNIEAAESIPKGLMVWREAIAKAQTSAQLSMALYMLEASIAWDKSIMKANCQFCHSGDNEDKLLLCDGCDKGYHTYCFKPKMENIPDGDWYCYECMNKATGERNCIVCGKKCGRNLILCDHCPRAYHTDCLQPALPKVPRGKWHCPTCQSKLPKKRSNSKRSSSGSNINSSSPSGSTNRSFDEISSSNMEPIVSPAREDAPPESPPPPTTTTPSKKEKGGGKKLAKEMAPCRQLLDDLESHDEAWPFLLPVNTKQFPTYKKIIKNPMDLSTIRKRLMDSGYKSREDFCSDVRLIFNNCETFNEDDSPVGKAGHGMRLFFETRWAELTNQKPPV